MLMPELKPLEYILQFLMLPFLDLYIHVVQLFYHQYKLLLIVVLSWRVLYVVCAGWTSREVNISEPEIRPMRIRDLNTQVL